ncbi:Carboxypeptidase regulatory-like domain-containing protein [Bryocella elongata]|uniref:Carboxypeptidase regulatory-like domain-containing protein n=1 Tax=Bryocella elongata TaxID=863522 RepID=A0A1H6AB30_9BACT|nr:TonB-dependent receptor [Bryocella elongata]SEG45394.1 Carboxypeptidase regulatory-like domain-containing protein [Bryocella elongata]
MNVSTCFVRALMLCALSCPVSSAAFAQTAKPTAVTTSKLPVLSGDVLDATGAAIPGAAVHLHSDQADADAVSDNIGHFTVSLAPGTYTLTAEFNGFRTLHRSNVVIVAGHNSALTLKLLAASDQEIEVDASQAADTSSSANRSALVFKNEQLDTFSDDPNVMEQQLESLSGGDPSNPPQLYVDGFSGGQMPSKDEIREVRINQNPFSAVYDQFGSGRIEILTKPGANKLHGNLDTQWGDSALNARNPYIVGTLPAYDSQNIYGSLTGPVNKTTSFFANVLVENTNSNASVNAKSVDPATLLPVQITQAVPTQSHWQSYRGRIDHQFGKTDTFIGQYRFNNSTAENSGVGQLVLAEAGSNSVTHRQIVQLSDTHIFNAKVILDSGLQYIRTVLTQAPVSTAPSVTVQGAFTGGGAQSQQSRDHQDQWELQEYFSISEGKHFIRTGMRFRANRDANFSRSNYNGQFTFPDLTTYTNALAALGSGSTVTNLPANARPTLFQYATGTAAAELTTADFGFYAEDEWKATKNLTLNYGVRFESQTAIPDHFDPAPRLGFAYAYTRPKAKAPLFVVRGGFGLFYTRFPSGNLLTAQRQNGVSQLSYNLSAASSTDTSPVSFYFTSLAAGASAGALNSLTASTSTPYRIAPNLTSPVTYQGMISGEHAFGKYGNINVGYYRRRSIHQFDSENVNAPMPVTGLRPMGGTQNIYQYSSDGISDGHSFGINGNLNIGSRLNAWGFYGIGSQTSTTGSFSSSSFVSNSYNIRQDEGPITGYSPHQLYTGFNAKPGLGFNVNMFLAVRSRSYFNITTGSDNNGDTIYNDRPSFATSATPAASLRQTPWGNFDITPQAGETIIPFNYARAPGVVYTESSISRDFRFGPRPAGKPDKDGKPARPGDAKYRLRFGAEFDNLFNHVNRAAPIGVLTSPYVGQSIAIGSNFGGNASANRSIVLHAGFNF